MVGQGMGKGHRRRSTLFASAILILKDHAGTVMP
jgi:hypothetical protein